MEQHQFFMNIGFIKLFLKNKKFTDARNQLKNPIRYFIDVLEFSSFVDLMIQINQIECEYKEP